MSAASKIRDFVMIAAAIGVMYLATQWYQGSAGSDDAGAMAEANCLRDVRNRLNAQSVRVNAVNANRRGYVVRASATDDRGESARVRCLTNDQGWVEDIEVIEY